MRHRAHLFFAMAASLVGLHAAVAQPQPPLPPVPAADMNNPLEPPPPAKRNRRSGGDSSDRTPSPGQNVDVVDIMRVAVDCPTSALKSFAVPRKAAKIHCDVLIAGGGTGGVAAALAAAGSGLKVCLAEETDWLGGQMTAQGVSALDENRYVESSGANRTYQALRESIRRHYRPMSAAAEQTRHLNPGNCWVSWLAFEPTVGLEQIQEALHEHVEAGNLQIYYRTKAVSARTSGNRITSVLMVHLDKGTAQEFVPRLCLDATELSDLLPLARLGYRTGAESRLETGEPHAPDRGDCENVQDFVYPFVVEFRAGEKNIIPRPPHYGVFHDKGKFSFLGYKMFSSAAQVTTNGRMVELLPFWEYRRLIHKPSLPGAPFEHDIAMINWESNDLRGENIIDKPPDLMAGKLALAKSLSLGFLYWLQTEAPRDDGGSGYPELALRKDVLCTSDGLSKFPYIRESRRINARRVVREQDIAAATNSGARARHFPDSVGIGLYPIDIHGHQEVPGAGQASLPFQIPLGSLIPKDCRNLLAAAKNIGTTHISNGAYRLHPVEWAIGEAAGTLAAFCLEHRTTPAQVLARKRLLRQLQIKLLERGAPLYWYDDVPTDHSAFSEIQFVSQVELMQVETSHLHFRPDDAVTRAEAAESISRLLRLRLHPVDRGRSPAPDVPASHPNAEAITACLQKRLLSLRAAGTFDPDETLGALDLLPVCHHLRLEAPAGSPGLTRSSFARWLFAAATGAKLPGSL